MSVTEVVVAACRKGRRFAGRIASNAREFADWVLYPEHGQTEKSVAGDSDTGVGSAGRRGDVPDADPDADRGRGLSERARLRVGRDGPARRWGRAAGALSIGCMPATAWPVSTHLSEAGDRVRHCPAPMHQAFLNRIRHTSAIVGTHETRVGREAVER